MHPQYSHLWDKLRAENPEHSAQYAQRWRNLAAEGMDLNGEARFVSALVAPGAKVLDAGCGQGRVGGYLADQGYVVAGVDLDDYLVAEAAANFPQAEWRVGDIATFDFTKLVTASDSAERAAGFDVIVSAGNVLTFIDPASRRAALTGLAAVLAPGGRFVSGFGSGRGYDFADYQADLVHAGFEIRHRFSSWDLRSFTADSDFLVCVAQ